MFKIWFVRDILKFKQNVLDLFLNRSEKKVVGRGQVKPGGLTGHMGVHLSTLRFFFLISIMKVLFIKKECKRIMYLDNRVMLLERKSDMGKKWSTGFISLTRLSSQL